MMHWQRVYPYLRVAVSRSNVCTCWGGAIGSLHVRILAAEDLVKQGDDLIFDLNAFVDDLRYRLWFFTSLSTVTITGPHLGTLHALHPIRER
jgi:hypothetical protein